MADFGGFQIETPQEVLARIQQQRQKALSSDDHVVRTIAMNDANMDAVFGNPEVVAAQRKQDAVAKAMATAMDSLPEGASDIDRARARLEAAQDALGVTDPAAAMQIESQLLKLDQEQFERSRLLQSDDRAQEEHELRIKEREASIAKLEDEAALRQKLGGQVMVVSGALNDPTIRHFNLFDEESKADFETYMAQTPDGRVVKPEHLIQRPGGDGGPIMGKANLREMNNKLNSSIRSMTFTNRLVDVLIENAGAGSTAERLAGLTNRFGLEIDQAAGLLRDAAANVGTVELDQAKINERLEEADIDSQRYGGLVLNLAYALAKALDENGRLSDPDVDRAIEMISGGANSRATIAKLRDSTYLNAKITLDEIVRHPDAAIWASGMSELTRQLGVFDEKGAKFETPGNAGAPAAPGGAPAATDDTYTTKSGVRVGF